MSKNPIHFMDSSFCTVLYVCRRPLGFHHKRTGGEWRRGIQGTARSAGVSLIHSMISHRSHPPRTVCQSGCTLRIPSVPDRNIHCIKYHILIQSFSRNLRSFVVDTAMITWETGQLYVMYLFPLKYFLPVPACQLSAVPVQECGSCHQS